MLTSIMPSYVIYARRSSESEDRQVLSIDSQIRELKALSGRLNVPLTEILTESRSAKAPGRPVFGELMRRVDRGEVSGIVCWKMDRLARNHFDTGLVLQALADKKLEKIVTSDGVKTPDGNDRLMGTFELAMATKFIDDLRANTKRGIRERLTRGWASYAPPPGYLNDRINKTIIKDPERFPLVRRMWELLLNASLRPDQIRGVANDQWGFRTRTSKRRGGKPLARSAIYRIFTNPFYMGVIQLRDGRTYAGAHEPMVTRTEFEDAQVLLSRPGRPRPKRLEFDFTGIFSCGNCGGAVTAEQHVKRSGRRYAYYHCSRQRSLAVKCREPAVPESELVTQLAAVLGSLTIPCRVLEWLRQQVETEDHEELQRRATVRRGLEDALRAARREEENLLSLRLRDLVTDEVYLAKRPPLEAKRQALEMQITKADQASAKTGARLRQVVDFAAATRETFLAGTRVQRRIILEAVGLNYTLRGRRAAFLLEKPFALLAEAGGCSNWLRVVGDVRTWLLEHPEFSVPDLKHLSDTVVSVPETWLAA